jgi:hypothetical protein
VSGHETPLAMLAAPNLEMVVEVENMWGEILSRIESVQAMQDRTENVSLRAALASAETALYEVSVALSRASLIARRDGR